MIPKKGKVFPNRVKSIGASAVYATAVSTALRAELGDTHQAIKKVARWTGANQRTVKNWLTGRSGPNGDHLVRIIQHSDSVLRMLLELAQRRPAIAGAKVAEAHGFLARIVAELGLIIGGQ